MNWQEAEARVVFQQLVLAVDYCHKMGVANRDIKLENVLLVDRTSPLRIKLTDFGCCKSDRDSITKTLCGTLGYMGTIYFTAFQLHIYIYIFTNYCSPSVHCTCLSLDMLKTSRFYCKNSIA